jgi:hypothetical protein
MFSAVPVPYIGRNLTGVILTVSSSMCSDDGDGDNENESGSENEEGGNAGGKKSSGEESSGDASDSDSSDMDVEDCDKRREGNRANFFNFYLLLLSNVADPDPGSGAFLTPGLGIRDGSKIRIRDEQPGSYL